MIFATIYVCIRSYKNRAQPSSGPSYTTVEEDLHPLLTQV